LLTSFHKIGAPIGNDYLKITINYKITGQNDTSPCLIDDFPE